MTTFHFPLPIFSFIAASAVLSGCSVSSDVSVAADVDAESWNSPATLILPNTDTVALRDMSLFMRCADSFAEDTLTVRIAMQTPDTLRYEEPFLWPFGDTTAPAPLSRTPAEVLYRRFVQLRRQGNYLLTLTPTRAVKGVEAVGVHFTKSE